MGELNDTSDNKNGFEGDSGNSLGAATETLPATEFVKVEKNLASLGFFTPSSKRLHNAQEKSFAITTTDNGQRIELKGTIIPSAKYGLPITADQDKWIALCKIISDIMRKEGRVTNPISFSSADILRLLHKHRHSGKNYREIEEWLDVLFSTTIFSEGVIYLAKEKRRVKDRFRVFDRVVSFGKELPDGRLAEKNYAWLSEWQLQNINSNHLLPIDLEVYRDLKNHIAKALVPLLQVWLYATRREGCFEKRREGCFEKRYDELCEFLNIQRYAYRSLIVRTLGPSLDELKQFGYLSDWRLDRTTDKDSFKIVLYHGEKFYRDRRARLKRGRETETPEKESPLRTTTPAAVGAQPVARVSPSDVRSEVSVAPELVGEFTRRGITERKAIQLLSNLKPGQDVLAQLELIDGIVAHPANKVMNPPGFYVRLIEANTPIPDGFETKAQRKARGDREQRERERRAAEEAAQELEWEYEQYCESEIDHYIEANAEEFESLKNAKWEEDRQRFSFTTESMAKTSARHEIRKRLTILSFEDFVGGKRQGAVFSLKSVAVPPSTEVAAVLGSEMPASSDFPSTVATPQQKSPSVAQADAGLPDAPVLLAADDFEAVSTIPTIPPTEDTPQRDVFLDGEQMAA